MKLLSYSFLTNILFLAVHGAGSNPKAIGLEVEREDREEKETDSNNADRYDVIVPDLIVVDDPENSVGDNQEIKRIRDDVPVHEFIEEDLPLPPNMPRTDHIEDQDEPNDVLIAKIATSCLADQIISCILDSAYHSDVIMSGLRRSLELKNKICFSGILELCKRSNTIPDELSLADLLVTIVNMNTEESLDYQSAVLSYQCSAKMIEIIYKNIKAIPKIEILRVFFQYCRYCVPSHVIISWREYIQRQRKRGIREQIGLLVNWEDCAFQQEYNPFADPFPEYIGRSLARIIARVSVSGLGYLSNWAPERKDPKTKNIISYRSSEHSLFISNLGLFRLSKNSYSFTPSLWGSDNIVFVIISAIPGRQTKDVKLFVFHPTDVPHLPDLNEGDIILYANENAFCGIEELNSHLQGYFMYSDSHSFPDDLRTLLKALAAKRQDRHPIIILAALVMEYQGCDMWKWRPNECLHQV